VNVFVDTSAFYALASASDEFHNSGKEIYLKLLENHVPLVTTSYVLVETMALIHRRLGFEVLEMFMKSLQGIVDIVWVDMESHDAGWKMLSAHKSKKVSMVDCVSFVTMQSEDSLLQLGFVSSSLSTRYSYAFARTSFALGMSLTLREEDNFQFPSLSL